MNLILVLTLITYNKKGLKKFIPRFGPVFSEANI